MEEKIKNNPKLRIIASLKDNGYTVIDEDGKEHKMYINGVSNSMIDYVFNLGSQINEDRKGYLIKEYGFNFENVKRVDTILQSAIKKYCIYKKGNDFRVYEQYLKIMSQEVEKKPKESQGKYEKRCAKKIASDLKQAGIDIIYDFSGYRNPELDFIDEMKLKKIAKVSEKYGANVFDEKSDLDKHIENYSRELNVIKKDMLKEEKKEVVKPKETKKEEKIAVHKKEKISKKVANKENLRKISNDIKKGVQETYINKSQQIKTVKDKAIPTTKNVIGKLQEQTKKIKNLANKTIVEKIGKAKTTSNTVKEKVVTKSQEGKIRFTRKINDSKDRIKNKVYQNKKRLVIAGIAGLAMIGTTVGLSKNSSENVNKYNKSQIGFSFDNLANKQNNEKQINTFENQFSKTKITQKGNNFIVELKDNTQNKTTSKAHSEFENKYKVETNKKDPITVVRQTDNKNEVKITKNTEEKRSNTEVESSKTTATKESKADRLSRIKIGSKFKLDKGKYFEAPDGSGKFGQFENRQNTPKYLSKIGILTENGYLSVSDKNANLLELKKKYPNAKFSYHFTDEKGNSLGWVTNESFSNKLNRNQKNQNRKIQNNKDTQKHNTVQNKKAHNNTKNEWHGAELSGFEY